MYCIDLSKGKIQLYFHLPFTSINWALESEFLLARDSETVNLFHRLIERHQKIDYLSVESLCKTKTPFLIQAKSKNLTSYISFVIFLIVKERWFIFPTFVLLSISMYLSEISSFKNFSLLFFHKLVIYSTKTC